MFISNWTLSSTNIIRIVPLREDEVVLDLNVLVRADVMIIACHHHIKQKIRKPLAKIFRITFHSAFITDGKLVAKLKELDDCGNRKKWSEWFENDFSVEMQFEEIGEHVPYPLAHKPSITESDFDEFMVRFLKGKH